MAKKVTGGAIREPISQGRIDSVESDFIYDKADSVQKGKGLNVRVKYKGDFYTAQLTWGQARDGDQEKCTVIIKTKSGEWAKLWFMSTNLN